jgi:hypothetical protein
MVVLGLATSLLPMLNYLVGSTSNMVVAALLQSVGFWMWRQAGVRIRCSARRSRPLSFWILDRIGLAA